MHQLIDS